MTVYRNEDLYDTSNVEYDGGRILRYDKRNRTPAMHHIDYGLGAFHRSVFEAIPAGQARDLATVYQDLLQAGHWRLSKCISAFMKSVLPKDCGTLRSF